MGNKSTNKKSDNDEYQEEEEKAVPDDIETNNNDKDSKRLSKVLDNFSEANDFTDLEEF